MQSKPAIELTGRLSRAFVSTRAILAKVQPYQLEMPTPCASWDVNALIEHFIGTAHWAASTIGASEVSVSNEDFDGDFLARYDSTIDITVAAFGSKGALDKTLQLPFGELSGEELMLLAASDQFAHGWDLARATGQGTDLDPGLADELLVYSHGAISQDFRGPDGAALFGPIADAPVGASSADRLAAFLGRPV
jgi:uncharacterized protein (TIGR03086 family)